MAKTRAARTSRSTQAANKTAKTAKTAKKRKNAVQRAVKRAPARAATKTARAKTTARKKTGARPSAAGRARNVVVMVGDQDLPAIHKVASQLRARGMKVDSILEATGMITGTYGKAPAALSRVKGVTGVEETAPIQLPPPESDIQ
jgi:hypothetical protein